MGGIRTISEGRGSQLLVGSTRNCILIGSLSMGFSPAVLGHTDELWALCPHPTLAQFLTAGFDRIVQLWDSLSRSVVWSKDIAVSYIYLVCIFIQYILPLFLYTGTSTICRLLQRWPNNNCWLCVGKMDRDGVRNSRNLFNPC